MNQLSWASYRCCLGALCCSRQPKVLKELMRRDVFLKICMEVKRVNNIFLDMKADLKKVLESWKSLGNYMSCLKSSGSCYIRGSE